VSDCFLRVCISIVPILSLCIDYRDASAETAAFPIHSRILVRMRQLKR
jgi:hypothetical protein